MPLIPPPEVDQGDPAAFYAALNAQVSIDAPSSGAGLQVTIENPDDLLPEVPPGTTRPLSTVFAVARGFVSFYPSGANLPTPNGQPMVVPPEMTGLDIGTVIQQVWAPDYRKLGTTVVPPELRTTHIAYIGLDRSSVENQFKELLPNLPTKALVKSWNDSGGSGPPPDRVTLESAFLQRAMSGDGSIFVAGGSPLGISARVSVPPASGTTPAIAGRFVLQTYFVPPQSGQSSFTDTESALDGIFEVEASGGANPYTGHPLVEANDSTGSIEFKSTFAIWNNVTRDFGPVSGCGIKLHKIQGETDTIVAATTTDGGGKIDISVNLSRRDKIQFEVDLVGYGMPIGNRLFVANLMSDVERAGRRLDNSRTNSFVYMLKYRAGDGYKNFYGELRENIALEKYEQDRGNAEKDDWLQLASRFTNQLLQHMDEFEGYYADGGSDAGAFKVLFEGDSWLSYPVQPGSRTDASIFSHLDDAIASRLAAVGLTYNRVPLQHFGDRADQMFGQPTATSSPVQWRFTKDFFDEYEFDLVILSAGGNDFAEPGVSNAVFGPWINGLSSQGDKATFPSAYTGDVFNPYAIGPQIPSDMQDTLRRKLSMSCASLLRNHPWNLYLHQLMLTSQASADAVKATLDVFLTNLGLSTTLLADANDYSDAEVKAAGAEIVTRLETIPLTFPGAANDPYNKMLAAVFDETLLMQRFVAVKANLEILLAYAQSKNIKVLTHTYCYPIFQQHPTALMWAPEAMLKGYYAAGPWFEPRFREANIESRYVRMMCLVSMIDNHVRLVLDPLKQQYPSCFDYVDLRALNLDPALWNDEMHLTDDGFATVAQAIFDHASGSGLIPVP